MYGKSEVRVKAFRAAAIGTCRTPDDWMLQPFGAGIIDTGRLCTDIHAALPTVAGSFPMPAVPAAPQVVNP